MQAFTTSYLNNFSILKNARIGFELEFYSNINYPMTLEVFNRKLNGIKVWGFKQYHSTFKPDNTNFKLEPDLSGGFNMAELVTGPMPYTEARLVLVQLMKIIQEIGYTTERSGIHINISFDGTSKKIEQVNALKMILQLDEKNIYEKFPDRVNNVYAKSIKDIIPFTGYDYSTSTTNVLSNSLLLPQTKYYGVNFSTLGDGRLEFRYLGGEKYEHRIEDILDFMDYFIELSWDCIAGQLDKKDTKLLRKYLDDNITKYKTMSKLDNFLSYHPTVQVEVDMVSSYDIVNAYFTMIYDDLFQIISSVKSLENCTVNYDTSTKRLEVIDAELHGTALIKNVDLIDCYVRNADLQGCVLISCEADKAILNHCKIQRGSEITDSKVLECQVDEISILKDCYFSEGYLNGTMEGGVFRSGKIGEAGVVSTETKVLNSNQNFFNLDISKQGVEKGKKGVDFTFNKKKGAI